MKLRDALIQQSPSLELQRAAAAEIARLDAALAAALAQPAAQAVAPDLIERICAAIKAADDKSVDEAGYMLDSNDCMKIVRDVAAAAPVAPIGYMNEGHLHELRQGRLPYGYVYPAAGPGAEVPVYTAAPVAQPLTPLTEAQADRLYDNAPDISMGAKSRAAFRRIVALTEEVHGISTSLKATDS